MTFALITEGISEHRIIKHILQKYFKDQDPEINQIQPKIIANKQEEIGGWNEVLKYCERTENLKNIFVDNDYLIIQIDTDQSQTRPFEVSHTRPDNEVKPSEELHADIVEKLQSLVASEIWEAFSTKIVFAICIHTIECWLLPFYYSNNQRAAMNNCLFKLNTELGRRGIHIITPEGKNNANSIRTYDTVLANWKKQQDIEAAAQHNAGFKLFIKELASINEQGIAPHSTIPF